MEYKAQLAKKVFAATEDFAKRAAHAKSTGK